MRVKFTPTAREQFLGAIGYIRRDKRSAALRFRQRVESSLRRIQEFPESGRRLPEFPELPHRELIIPPYRVFYRIVGSTIWVVGFWHGAQMPQKPGLPKGPP